MCILLHMSRDLWSHPPLLHCSLLRFLPCNFHNFCFSATILTSKSGQICLISAIEFTVSDFSASKHQEGHSPVAIHTFTSHIIRQNPKMHWHLKLLTLSQKVTHPELTCPLTSHSQNISVNIYFLPLRYVRYGHLSNSHSKQTGAANP